MALTPVQKQIEELFNVPQEPYDPLTPSALGPEPPAPHLNLTGSSAAGETGAAAPDLDSLFDGLTPETPSDSPGYGTALGRSFRAGIQDVGALGLGALEYGARQTALTHESGAVRGLARDATGALSAGRQSLEQNAQNLMASLTPEQQAQAQQQIFTLDPDKTIFRDGPVNTLQALGLKLARMTPPSLTTLLPGALIARVATAPAAIAYLAGSEATMSIGGIQNQIANEVMAAPEEELLQAPAYTQMLESGMDPASARQRLIAEAQGAAPLIGGVTVAAISAVAGRYFTPIFERGGGANIVQRFGRGYAAEAPQEAGQGAAEQYAANVAARLYDEDRSATQGVLAAAGEEGVLGGIFGGALGAVMGRGPPAAESLAAPPSQEGGVPATGGPESFEQVFGPEGQIVDTSGTPENLAARAARGGYLTPEEQDFLAANTPGRLTESPAPATAPMAGRQLAGQGALELYQPGELQAIGRQYSEGQATPLRGQTVAPLPTPPPIQGPQPVEQLSLPLQGRRGQRRRGQPPLPPVPSPTTDFTDVPSAEPEGDIRAQLADMQRPGSLRRGVFLSRANLSQHGTRGLEGIGVPMPNFDGQRGLMIARDEETARQLRAMRAAGRPMQEILGAATGAGAGKPADGDTAVQRRDGAGNVVQESLVDSTQADALVSRWRQEFPNDEVVVLSPEEVIQRRDGLISDEMSARQADLVDDYNPPIKFRREPMEATRRLAVESKVEQAMDDELLEGERPRATTTSRAAAQLVARGAREAAGEQRVSSRTGGFFAPKQLAFRDQGQRDRYASAFSQLVTDELTITEIEQEYAGKVRPPDVIDAYKKAMDSRKATRELLKRIRSVAKPTRRSEAAVRAAGRVEPHIVKRLRDEIAPQATKEPTSPQGTGYDGDTTEDARSIIELLPEQVEGMHGQLLDDTFYRAARVSAGKRAYSKFTYGKGAKSGHREDTAAADEPVAEKIVIAEQIPEGAEPVVYSLPATVSGKREAKLGAIRKVGKNRWQFVIKQDGVTDTVVKVSATTQEEVKAKADELIERHNKNLREDRERGLNLGDIIKRDRSPSMKRKTIMRVAAQLRRREHGGKEKAAKITREAKTAHLAQGGERDEAVTTFDTGVLTQDTTKQDESVEARVKRQARARAVRSELSQAIDNANASIGKLTKGVYAELASEQGNDGLWSEAALNFHYGRMYLRQVMEFGRAMINSDIDSASMHKEMEKVSNFINEALRLNPRAFAAKMSSIARADIRTSILAKSSGKRGVEDKGLAKLKAQLSNPVTRRESMNEWNAKLQLNAENFLRLNKAWRTNDLFMSAVEPVIRKFSDSAFRDGYPSYVPTKIELEALDWALQDWYNVGEPVVVTVTKDGIVKFKDYEVDLGLQHQVFYEPVRRFLTDLGYTFDEDGRLNVPEAKNELGHLAFLPAVREELDQHRLTVAPKAAERLYRSRFPEDLDERDAGSGVAVQVPVVELEYGERKDDGSPREVITKVKMTRARAGTPVERSVSTIYKEHQRVMERMRYAKDQRERDAIVEQESVWAQANRLIAEFRKAVSQPKATVEALYRAERRLVRALTEIGVFRASPSPIIGALTLPGSNLETKPINLAGPRLRARMLTKDKARAMMLKLSEFVLPKPGASDEVSPREAKQIARAVSTLAQTKTNVEIESEYYDLINAAQHGDAFLDTAVELRSMLNAGGANGHVLLDKIIESVPPGHPYHDIAQVMRQVAAANVPVQWGRDKALPSTSLARYRTKLGDVIINRAELDALNLDAGSDNAAAAMIHAVLHELSHAATLHALKNDRQVRHEFAALQRIARRILQARGEELPYGLRHQDPVEEFVSEAFTNTAMQNQLDAIKMEMQEKSLLQTIWDYIKGLFGFPVGDTLLDLVFAKTDRVFTDRAYVIRDQAADEAFDLENVDAVGKTYIRGAANRLIEHARFRRALKAGKWAGVRAPLSLMTLGQIRNEFKARVDGLEEYYKAFKNRDARNSEQLERAERLSREWTKLTEKDGTAQATRFSELATLSTVHGVHPDKPLNDPANAHIKLDEQKAHYKTLRAEFEQLPQPWKDHYVALQKYYQQVLRREAVLLTQNALRAVLTKGANAPMEAAKFESTYTFEKVSELGTEEALRAEFGKHLDDDMLKTISAMRTLPEKRTGAYFPIMRYGEYVVEGRSEREVKRFASRAEAVSYQARLLADDPTLVVEIADVDGAGATVKVSERAFLLAESATEAQIKREELLEDYDHVPVVTKKLDYATESTIRSNEALGRILDRLEGNAAAQSAMRQYYLRTLSDSSFRKHEIKRKMRRGYDSKLQHRNFTNYAQAASYYTAQLEFGWKMSQAMTKMVAAKNKIPPSDSREGVRISEVVQSIQHRDKLSADPTVVNDLVRKGVSFAQFTMLTSPSYWMINATQPYMVSLPYMAARHPLGAVIGAMSRAQKMIIHPLVGQAWSTKAGLAAFWSKTKTEQAFNVLDEVKASITAKVGAEKAKPILDMLDALRRESILDLSWIAELRDIAEGRDTGVWQKTLDASRIMSHLTEVNNRILTAIAAYDLAIRRGTHDEAVEYAKDVVQQTHFDYSSGNKPILFRPDGPLGAAAPLVFQFMQWPQHMYAMLISNMVKVLRAKGVERKEAAKILGGLLGTHMLAGGLIGVTLQPIKWAVGLAMMALGDDDEPYTFTNAASGATFDRLVQEGAATAVGPGLAELLARGVPAKLGTDQSDRMALGTLYHMDLRTDTTESALGSLVTSVGGPWLTIGENGVRAVGDIMEGNIARGIERVAPKAVRDMFKTYRYASEGLVNNAGDTVIEAGDLPPQQLFLQALGFAPAEVDKFYDRQSVIKDKERYGADRRDAIIARFVRAGTPDERKEALREVAEFKRAFPAARITRSTLVQSAQSARERERNYRRYGANISDKERRYADEGWYFE